MPISRAGSCSKRSQGWERIASRLWGISQSGFTFLELALIIFIFSLVFALVLPSVSSIGENKVQSDAKRIASIIRYLNDCAQSTKTALSLKIDFKRGLLRYQDPDGEREEKFESLRSVELTSKGTVSEGEVIFFFGPLGPTENLTIRVGEDKKLVKIVFNYLSGRVTITGD